MITLKQLRGFVQPIGYIFLGGESFFDLWRLKKKNLGPRLFIIGAQKCGTSSLHTYLKEHPEVFMSTPLKEPGYYVPWKIIKAYYKRKNNYLLSRSDLLRRGMLRGYKNERYIGESSTFYSNGDYNISKNTWLKNNINVEELRIIYLMKNPIERIISHYFHTCRHNDFEGDINKFVRVNKEAIGISRYGHQISTYFDYLNKNQILLLKFENLVNQPQAVMEKVYSFLELPSIVHESFGVFNAAPENQQNERTKIKFEKEIFDLILEAIAEDRKILKRYTSLSDFEWSYSDYYIE